MPNRNGPNFSEVLFLPRLYFELAYAAGLGAKNSQGFGMIEVVEKEER